MSSYTTVFTSSAAIERKLISAANELHAINDTNQEIDYCFSTAF
jgi:hypothetical protein